MFKKRKLTDRELIGIMTDSERCQSVLDRYARAQAERMREDREAVLGLAESFCRVAAGQPDRGVVVTALLLAAESETMRVKGCTRAEARALLVAMVRIGADELLS